MSLVTLIALATLSVAEPRESVSVPPPPSVSTAAEIERAMNRKLRFNIREGPARETLPQWFNAADVQMVFPAEFADGVSTASVKGVYTLDNALKALLDGTGMTYEWQAADVVTVVAPKEDSVTTISPPLTEADRVLIEDTCQFGRISTAQVARLIGETPGYCWCCMRHQSDEPHGPLFCTPIVTAESCAVFDSREPDAYQEIIVKAKHEKTQTQKGSL